MIDENKLLEEIDADIKKAEDNLAQLKKARTLIEKRIKAKKD